MKKILPFLFSFLTVAAFGQTKLIITGTYDGPLSGGHPKGVELFTLDAIDDLSIYGIGSANNGGGTDSVEFTFPTMTVGAGAYLYICADAAGFQDFFGFAPDFEASMPMGINGDDAIELFMNGNVVDVFGDINVDGTDEPWEHLDGWAYRSNATGPDGSTFQLGSWFFSGKDAFDGETSNATAAIPFPLGTYSLDPNVNLQAIDDYLTTQQEIGITANLLSNDNLPNGFDQVLGGIDPPNGVVTYAANGDVTYVPNAGYCGDDEFSYTVCLNNDCDTASVFVTVECPITYEPKTIGEVTINDSMGLPEADSSFVELTGVVHSINFRPGGLQFVLIDSNNDGIIVFSGSDNLGYTVAEGDELTARGQIGAFRGTTQLYVDEIMTGNSGNMLFDPTVVTELNESTESQLVEIKNLTIVDPSDWSNSGSGFNVDVTDGANTYAMRIVSATNIFGSDAPVGSFNLVGIGGQFAFDAPFDGGYQIFPRYWDDISINVNSEELTWENSITISPNPVSDFLTISGAKDVARITVFNNIGQPLQIIEEPNVNHSFSTSYLSKGVYFLRFENENQQWVAPFVKQ